VAAVKQHTMQAHRSPAGVPDPTTSRLRSIRGTETYTVAAPGPLMQADIKFETSIVSQLAICGACVVCTHHHRCNSQHTICGTPERPRADCCEIKHCCGRAHVQTGWLQQAKLHTTKVRSQKPAQYCQAHPLNPRPSGLYT
jgi:hypothetical protein